MRPVLDALGIAQHTITRLDETEFVVDRTIRQAVATRPPACLILSPLLTGGKRFSACGMSAALGTLHNARTMNRAELTRRLVAKLSDPAVIGGIGSSNFDLWAAEEAEFEALAERALAAPGPRFIAARIDDKPAVPQTERNPVRIRDSFMRGLGSRA